MSTVDTQPEAEAEVGPSLVAPLTEESTTAATISDGVPIKKPYTEDLEVAIKAREMPEKQRNMTLRTGISGMFLSTVGVGIFVLPFYFAMAGLLVGILSMCIGAAATLLTCETIIRLAILAGTDNLPTMINHHLTPLMKRISAWLLVLWVWSLLLGTAGFGISMNGAIQAVQECSVPGKEGIPECSHPDAFNKWVWVFVVFFITLPFCIQKELNSIRHLNTVATCGQFGLIIMFFALCVQKAVHNADDVTYPVGDGEINPFKPPHVLMATDIIGFSMTLSLGFLAFSCQFNCLPVFAEMKNQEDAIKMLRITLIGMVLPVYLAIGIFGYFVIGYTGETSPIVWTTFKTQAGNIGMLLLALIVCCKIPITIHGMRDTIMEEVSWMYSRFISKGKPIPNTLVYRLAVAAPFLLISIIIPSVWDKLGLLLEIGGGVMTPIVAFCLPGVCFIMYARNKPETPGGFRNDALRRQAEVRNPMFLGVASVVLGIVLCISALGTSIYQIAIISDCNTTRMNEYYEMPIGQYDKTYENGTTEKINCPSWPSWQP